MRPWIDRLVAWRRPAARLRAFAETEAFGGADLARAAAATPDPWIRRQLVRHAEDEARHAALLGEQAAAPGTLPLGAALAGETAVQPRVDVEQLGDIGFLAFVHLSEQQATAELARSRAASPEHAPIFDQILEDERRHVAWAGHALQRFRDQGRGAEVDAGLRSARWQRRLLPFRWILGRFADLSSALILGAIYLLVLPPFKLLAPRPVQGWQTPPPHDLQREF